MLLNVPNKSFYMSITIENTFTSDKQIYYPINYHLNKTSDQVYAEFKTTLPFLIFRHLTELTLAICFVFLLFLIIKAVKEIKRLHKLPPTNVNKMRNQMFLEKGFLWGLAMLTMIWILILWIILKESWAI